MRCSSIAKPIVSTPNTRVQTVLTSAFLEFCSRNVCCAALQCSWLLDRLHPLTLNTIHYALAEKSFLFHVHYTFGDTICYIYIYVFSKFIFVLDGKDSHYLIINTHAIIYTYIIIITDWLYLSGQFFGGERKTSLEYL